MLSHPLVPALDGETVRLGAVLDRQVELLREAHRSGDPVAAALLRGTGTEPFFGATARGAARHLGHTEIAALIGERMRPDE